ncbi:transient receptor potential cation channel protein painless-like [Planococcus citri]|uniref:transient receptor potential cation channel protein painless-like n=1 Tax=Planococcus citri TaxID=170843 RepID=UPI0031F7937A
MQNLSNYNSLSIQNRLLFSLKEQHLSEFKQIIESNSNSKFLNVNFFYEFDGNNGTLLDIACRSSGNSEFVRILLSNFSNVNVINPITGKAPIHEAVEKSDTDTVNVLIKKYWYSHCNINLPDKEGDTALHIVIKLNKINFMKILLQNPNRIDINISTRQNPTPLHLALLQGNLEAASLLLKYSNIDLDFQQDAEGRTCRQIIQQQYQQQFGQRLSTIRSTCDIGSILFSLLKRRETQLFENLASQVDVRFLNENHNGCQTYLQCACDLGLVSTVNMLLSKGVNPNKTVRKESLTPAMIAAHNGFNSVLQSLITSPNIRLQIVELGSVLHSVIEGMFNVTADQREGYRKCLQLILNEATPYGGLDLNFEDHDGFTSLFQAMMLNDDQVIKSLIYAGARFYQINYKGEIYLMINSSSLSGYLDSCISSRNESPFVIDPEIIIDYKALIQPNENFAGRIVYEMEIFTVLESSLELRKLLKHPVLVSFLYMKWHLVKRYYFINFAIYLCFCLSLSLYISYIYHDSPSPMLSSNWNSEESCLKIFLSKLIDNDRMKRYINDALSNITTSQIDDNFQHPSLTPLTSSIFISWCTTQIFYGILIFRELFQFFVSPKFYLKSPENWLEMTVIFISAALLYHPRPHQLSPFTAVVILASWIELVFLLGRHPSFATEIQMFKTVMWNFLKFMTLYSSMILAFAFSFYILMKPDPADDSSSRSDFSDPAMSIFKSIIMLTGEFNLESIPLGSPVLNFNHLVFILFVFFISIVLYNLLNGLAISDTQAIREDAELVGIVSQIKLISYLELLSNRNPFHHVRGLSRYTCCGSLKTSLIRIELKWLSFYRRMYRDKISLWPQFVAGTHIRVLSHRKNTVLFPDAYDWKKGTYRYSKRYNWEIHPSIVKRAKEILEKRNESNETDTGSQKLPPIDHYQSKFDSIEKNVQFIATEVLNLKSEVGLFQKNILSGQEGLQDVMTEIRDLKNKIDQLKNQPVF